MRQFFVVGGVSLWCRAFLSRGGGFLSNARNSAGAGHNKHTPLASEVVSTSFLRETQHALFLNREMLPLS